MEINSKIISICGQQPNNEKLIEIGNDPNFIFEINPLFKTLTLYNQEGGVINVNSWLECVNYANGGWVSNVDLFINEEKILFFFLLPIFLIISSKQIIKVYGNIKNKH